MGVVLDFHPHGHLLLLLLLSQLPMLLFRLGRPSLLVPPSMEAAGEQS